VKERARRKEEEEEEALTFRLTGILMAANNVKHIFL
jgi:hypothetical protein